MRRGVINFTIFIFVILSFVSCKEKIQQNQKSKVAKIIVQNSCNDIKDILETVNTIFDEDADQFCDCIEEIVVPVLTEKYTIEELKDIKENATKRFIVFGKILIVGDISEDLNKCLKNSFEITK